MWAARQCLRATRTCRGRAILTGSAPRMRLLWQTLPLPSSAQVNSGTSVAYPGSFLRTTLVAAWSTLQPLQTVSTQPIPVPLPGLSSEAQVSAPSLLHTPVDLCLGLGSVGKWPLCCSLCSDCCKLAALLSSEPLKLPFCPI